MAKMKVESADGDMFEIYKTSVMAKIDSLKFLLPLGFSDKPNVTPLIGRAGFFTNFKITFDEIRKITILDMY